jgi:catechol 2,3-dioxygenase-like lactoylglutathione lyase family enzyme
MAQTIVFVEDVARMRAFYQGMLGLPVITAEPGWVRLEAGGVVLALHVIKAGPRLPEPPPERVDSYIKLATLRIRAGRSGSGGSSGVRPATPFVFQVTDAFAECLSHPDLAMARMERLWSQLAPRKQAGEIAAVAVRTEATTSLPAARCR